MLQTIAQDWELEKTGLDDLYTKSAMMIKLVSQSVESQSNFELRYKIFIANLE